MPQRIFLALVGFLYAALSLWCSFDPATTSTKVGFQILNGSGQSEFLTVYGGLEMGLALVFLWPIFRPQFAREALWVCLLIHGSLVLFRSIGFFLFDEIAPMTKQLAIGEWVIFLLAAGLCVWPKPSSGNRV